LTEWTSANVIPPDEGGNNVCSPLRCCGKKGLFGIPQERRAVAVVISMMDRPGPANGKVAMTRATSALAASQEAASTIKMTTTNNCAARGRGCGGGALSIGSTGDDLGRSGSGGYDEEDTLVLVEEATAALMEDGSGGFIAIVNGASLEDIKNPRKDWVKLNLGTINV
jgi:hypothetical protein